MNENKRMQGWNTQKSTKLDGNATTTLSHHLVPFCQVCLNCVCYNCVCCSCACAEGGLWKAVGRVVLHECVVHGDVHGEVVLFTCHTPRLVRLIIHLKTWKIVGRKT